jgi:hypothetical protein
MVREDEDGFQEAMILHVAEAELVVVVQEN